ncbi:LCP family protein [Leuconostoc citreum]
MLGTDTGTDGGFGSGRDRVGLTDSLMLVTVNPQKETTTLVSVPRDIMTSISGFESSFPQKLNAAYAFREASDDKASLGDGVGTTMETIQKMFNIPINYFAMVNMSGLGDVVDQLGGVKAKSPLSFKFSQDTAHEDGNNLYDFTEGKTSFEYAADGENFKKYDKMDGKAALAFSRMRYQDPQGDYGRTQRQRILLQAIMTKIKSDPSTILNTKFISATTKNIASNMKMSDMLALGSNYMNATKTIDSYTVQGEGEMYDGVSYQRVTTAQRQAITNKLRAALELKPEDTGSEFGSTVTESQIAQVGSADTLFSQFNTKSNENLTSN